MKVLGKIITCMVKECILGVMEGNMKENITWTKNMAMGFTIGPMEENMKEIGRMGSNMEKESICFLLG